MIYELADLREVVQALTKALEITDSEISAVQNRKREKSGGFQAMHFTNFVEIENDNPVIELTPPHIIFAKFSEIVLSFLKIPLKYETETFTNFKF